MITGKKYKETEARLGVNLSEHLRALYDAGHTGREIARIIGVSEDTLGYWRKKLGLIRSQSETNKIVWQKGGWDREKQRQRVYESGFHKAPTGRPCPWKGEILPEEWRDSISKGMTGRRVGEAHPLWKGGITVKHYGSGWKRAKRLTRKRANYHCEICGIPEKEIGKSLDVHHIMPFKKFSNHERANRLENLKAVCRKCHMLLESQIA